VRRRNQRLIVIAAAGALLAAAVGLTLVGLQESIVYFVSPSELAEKAEPGRRVRLGGLVLPDSVRQEAGGVVYFSLTDGESETLVRYQGLLPDLFVDGQGAVAEGSWRPGEPFEATRVLAKHDETYMPREVAQAIKQRGEWRGEDTQ